MQEKRGSNKHVQSRRRRTRTAKVRTVLSCPCSTGQTDNGQSFFENPDKIPTANRIDVEKIRTDRHQTAFFLKIRTDRQRTESRQQTDTEQDFPENPDKKETRTVLSVDVWSRVCRKIDFPNNREFSDFKKHRFS